MSIDVLIDELISREGGYSNNPADKGGPTMYGITEHVARAHGYAGPMRGLPRSTAASIYKEIYWLTPHFDQVATRLPALAEELFDTGVNMGPETASRMLQRTLNVLNQGTLYYPDLIVDGKLGRMTLYALDHLIAKRGAANAELVVDRAVNAQQAVRYMELAENNKTQETFMYGWLLNRVE